MNPEIREQGVDNGYEELSTMIQEDFNNDPGSLIMILQSINERYNYLPREALELTAKQVGVPLSKIYGIATFYKAFSLEPRGDHIIKICVGTACHVRGGQRVKERLEETMHLPEGGTTEDKRFSLETVRCIGCCSLGPVVMIDNDTFSRTNSDKILKTLDNYN